MLFNKIAEGLEMQFELMGCALLIIGPELDQNPDPYWEVIYTDDDFELSSISIRIEGDVKNLTPKEYATAIADLCKGIETLLLK